MYFKKHILPSLIVCMLLCSCKKYVEVQPKGKITPTAVSDYQLLLNNTSIWNLSTGTSDLLTDDVALTDPALLTSISSTAYYSIYQFSNYYYQVSQDDPEWNLFYQQIYTANVIINGLPTATSGTDAQKQEMTAEAKTHRAYAYLCLVNLYARQYDSSAATTPGVPLLLVPTYTQSLARATVGAIYTQILSDLNSSISALPPLPANKAAASQAAAYALLARTYLYMGDYANALTNANQALALQSTLLNLNNYTSTGLFPGFVLPLGQNNPEVIFLKASVDADAPLGLSAEFLQLLGTKDLRYPFYTYNGPDLGYYNGTYFAYFAPLESPHEGPTVGEMMLTQAECLARTQHGQDGLTVVNTLRKARFKPADYTALTAPNDAQALVLILQERRRELFGRGYRLFDLKRLNLDPAMVKTVTHPFGSQSLTLAPGSNRYIYPIPQKVVGANPEIVQNPR
jgi:tetratricopeptide (TPR) repeat protein